VTGFYEGSNNGQASPGVVGGNTFMSPSSPLGPPTLSSTFREPSPQSPAGGGIQQNGEPWPYSPRHDAIYTTVARILASFWNIKLLRMGTVEGTKVNVVRTLAVAISSKDKTVQKKKNFYFLDYA